MALRRSLSTFSLSFFGLGMVLGAGIYSVIGAAAGHAGDAVWQSFLVGAIVALLTGLSFAELATMMPRAGAEPVYLRTAFPGRRVLPATIGIIILLASAATAATVSLAFGGYLAELVRVPAIAAGLGLVALATAVNVLGVREAAWLNIVLTLLEIGGLVLVIWLALANGGVGDALTARPNAGVLPAAGLVFFAYLGFEEIVNLAEEAKEPARDIPRAILVSVGVSTVLYVLVAMAAVSLVPAARLAGSDSPLAVAAGAVSARAATVVAPLALVATSNTALAALVTGSRMAYGMARDGDLPSPLSRELRGRQTPWIACLAVGAVAAAMVPLGSIELVAGMASLGALAGFCSVNVAVIVLRRRKPDAERPFRVPGAIAGVPVLPALGLLSCLVLVTTFERKVHAGFAIAALAALGLAWWSRRARHGSRA